MDALTTCAGLMSKIIIFTGAPRFQVSKEEKICKNADDLQALCYVQPVQSYGRGSRRELS